MATTTNYGWTTPDDTALVKDGASAIRTLGTSVDTTTKNLNPETTLGDIAYRSSTSNVNTRLGIGSSGQYLSVSGGVPAWVTLSAGGITLLSTTSLSGASTTVSSIDQTYTNLYVVMSGFYTSGGAQFTIKPNGTNNIGNNVLGAYANVSTLVANTNILSPGIGTSTTAVDSVAYLDVNNYANTSMTKAVDWYGSSNNGTDGSWIASGSFRTTSAISSLVFAPSSGTWSGGSVRIYGVK